MQSQKENKRNQRLYWAAAIGLIVTGIAAPVGVLMIVLKLLAGSDKPSPSHSAVQRGADQALGSRTTDGPAQQRTSQRKAGPAKKTATSQEKQVQSALKQLLRRGKRLTLWGAVLGIFFALVSLSTAADYLFLLPEFPLDYMAEVIPLLSIAAVGGGMAWTGLRRQKQARLFRQFLNTIGSRQTISISTLASTTGCTPQQVRATLEDMLEFDLFPQGYLDHGGDQLILSAAGVQAPPKSQPAPKAEAPKEDTDVLNQISQLNRAIKNEKMSAQITRIRSLTARILEYQREHPDKSPQLHRFLSYYLPTTLKLLSTYAQLESQQVSGQNITAAMERIEGMMDKVVEGFEQQLDNLFQGQAMDIAADVEVLERMLAKDGLSQDQLTMTL